MEDEYTPTGEIMDDQVFVMCLEANRLGTFSQSWPFRDENAQLCTPAKMAEAGFYHCPTQREPDLVRCFVCMKELNCWDPQDDPWPEHASHSPRCPFVLLGKAEWQQTLKEHLRMDCARFLQFEERRYKRKLDNFNSWVRTTRRTMLMAVKDGAKKERRTASQGQ